MLQKQDEIRGRRLDYTKQGRVALDLDARNETSRRDFKAGNLLIAAIDAERIGAIRRPRDTSFVNLSVKMQ